MFMLGKPLTAEQRLEKAVIDIMAKDRYRALTGVLMVGSKRVCDNTPTAYTNGRDEIYGRAFAESLNDAELRFLVLHEVKHKMYKHLTTWRWMFDEDPDCANMACDYVINVETVDENKDGFATMTGELTKGCYDEKYRGWDSAAVYHDLRKQKQGGGGGGGQGQGGSGGKPGFDEHGWDDAKEMTAEEKRELARAIDEALRQGALVAGKTGSGGDRTLGELLTPQVRWQDALREFITSTCTGHDYSTWRRPNRRYLSAGIYMPSGITEQIGEIILAVDTSGSIGQRQLNAFFSEAVSIAETVHPEAIRILYWDTKVCRDERYEPNEFASMAQSTKPAGGGGTMVECVPEYIAEKQLKAQAVIVLTDGYLGGSWGNWHNPILWCVLDNANAAPPVGKTVHIKGYDL